MSLVRISFDAEKDFGAAAPVGAPIGEPVARARTAAHQELPFGSSGIWECSPGRFRRQVSQAEYSHIVSGTGSFTPDGAEPIEFSAGDSLYFEANTQGEWEIRQTVRKIYCIFGA